MPRDYAAEGRAKKAGAIAEVLRARGGTAAAAEALDDEGRRAAEALARVNKGSDETWAAVIGLMRGFEQVAADEKADADPFRGLPGA